MMPDPSLVSRLPNSRCTFLGEIYGQSSLPFLLKSAASNVVWLRHIEQIPGTCTFPGSTRTGVASMHRDSSKTAHRPFKHHGPGIFNVDRLDARHPSAMKASAPALSCIMQNVSRIIVIN